MRSENVLRHRLTVDDYHRMGEAGILKPDARVELIEGEIIDMAPIGSRHAYVIAALTKRLMSAVGIHAEIRCQLPVRLDNHSEPEPDLAVVKPRGRHYESAHPTPSDVLLLIEISDSTLAFDRSVKLPLYAKHGVQEVWLVDLSANQIHAHRDPRDGIYEKASLLDTSSRAAMPPLHGVTVDLRGMF
jgi:Uma2 family endonuclease